MWVIEWYMEYWNAISLKQSTVKHPQSIIPSHCTDRIETFERQGGPFLWDGIRLSRRRNRGQLCLYYVLYNLIQAANATAMFIWLNSLIDSPMYSWTGPSILVDLLNGLDWQVRKRELVPFDYIFDAISNDIQNSVKDCYMAKVIAKKGKKSKISLIILKCSYLDHSIIFQSDLFISFNRANSKV